MNLTERLQAVKTDRYALFRAIICAFLLILILYSMYVRVRMYMLGITLWIDEAFLAENIVDRTMAEMLTPPLVNLQTAPALYLIVVKTLTLLFGTSEAVLRVFSFAALVLMLIVQYALMRRAFKISALYSLFSVAVSSTFLFFMQHSNELKPYTGDAAFVLLVLLGYYFYREGKLGQGLRGAVLLALICAACMLFSTPAAFAAGAVFIVEFLLKCIRKDKEAVIRLIIAGLVFIAIFALNYMLWLRPIATNEGMVDYWEGYILNLNIFAPGAFRHNYELITYLFGPVWHAIWILLPFSVAGFALSLAKRNVYTLATGVFFVLLLIASSIEKYPIADRLWLFLYAIIFIYAFIFIDKLRLEIEGGAFVKIIQRAIPLFFAFLLLVPNLSFPAFGRGEEWTLVPGNQANPLIAHVEENIEDGEMLYSFHLANYILRFKNGYHTSRIGNVAYDNIIFGTKDFDEDVEMIVATGGSYILFYHSYYPLSGDWSAAYITEQLQERGYLEEVMNVFHTPLYWFTTDIERVRNPENLVLPE